MSETIDIAEHVQDSPEEELKGIKKKQKRRRRVIFWIFLVAHLLGISSSFDALMSTRTPQGTIAWIISLNTVPLVSVPSYWIFGRTKFQGYIVERQNLSASLNIQRGEIIEKLEPFRRDPVAQGNGIYAAEQLSFLPFLKGNSVELLLNGQETYDSILEGIEAAEEYILVQFYIVQDDGIGNRLKDALIQKAEEGLDVWFLYDEIGTRGLEEYFEELETAGVQTSSFHSTRGPRNRFQLNFRNHRKIVVADGTTGWVGGHNVGDEHLGLDEAYGNWRDTHVKIAGPSVLELQLVFWEDWRWATEETLELPWPISPPDDGDATILILPSGPADRLETCSLMYQQAIHSANERIWIASPYFVPDEGVMSALHLASLRGVDVKIIIPDKADNALVQNSPYAFIGDLLESGIEIYRYEDGFMHQKVFLIDDSLAGVGTANFDNRSFRLNFEVTALILDPEFHDEMEEMFENDMKSSRRMTLMEMDERSVYRRALSRLSYLTAPIQ